MSQPTGEHVNTSAEQPDIALLIHPLGQLAQRVSEVRVGVALSSVDEEYKAAQRLAGFKEAAKTLIPGPEDSYTDEESSRIAAQNTLAKHHYDHLVARRTPVEYGENYVLNNGDVGVALHFNEEGTEFFNILASKDNPDHYSMSWRGSDNIMSDFTRVSSVLVNYRPGTKSVSTFIMVAGEETPRDYEDMSIGDFEEVIRMNVVQGIKQTAVGFVLENGDSFTWTSSEDSTAPDDKHIPIVEVELSRKHPKFVAQRLIMRSSHRGVDSTTNASMDAFDRVAHVANF